MRQLRQFDTDTIKLITTFENITHSDVQDCIRDSERGTIYFLVKQGKIAKAIGKNGRTIKIAEKMVAKQIKVFEYSENEEQFIKNLISQAQKISIADNKATVFVKGSDRGLVIGRNGSNIKIIREFLLRNSSIKELEVR